MPRRAPTRSASCHATMPPRMPTATKVDDEAGRKGVGDEARQCEAHEKPMEDVHEMENSRLTRVQGRLRNVSRALSKHAGP
jgi:hypothetical protein